MKKGKGSVGLVNDYERKEYVLKSLGIKYGGLFSQGVTFDYSGTNLDGLGLSKGQLSNITNKLGNFDTSKFSGVLEGGLGDISSKLESGLGGIEGKLGNLTDKLGGDT